MKYVLLLVFGVIFATNCMASTIIGEYPICTTQEDARAFGQAKMFTQHDLMEDFVTSGKCTFVEPEIKATIVERSTYYKVLVFKPYGNPIKGWTDIANIIQ